MAKYLILWELDQSRIPENPKERGVTFTMMVDLIKEDIRANIHTDWGAYIAGGKGYAVSEGDELELAKLMQRFVPFVKFEIHQVMTIDQVGELAKSLS
ncbi:MAG TPA: hypothetical protein G4O18_04110 [Dehalococcoidia bacterium]|nr:hypothetical protein [Dehalococcoidia bacterium]